MITVAELPSNPCCRHSLNITQQKLHLQEFRNMLVDNMLADKSACLLAWSHSNWLHKLTGQRLVVHDLHAGSCT